MSSNALDDYLPPPQRRIRHITSLQVRNLTPFPARDALAQTLTQPGPSSLPQQPADDIELTVASRRRRRISASSITTIWNPDTEEDGSAVAVGIRKQTRSGSRGSFQSGRNGSGAPVIRPRARTSSKSSSVQLPTASAFNEHVNPSSQSEQDGIPVSGHFVTHSQRALEKIVSSRLVETFATLSLQSSSTSHSSSQPSSPQALPSSAAGMSRKGKDVSVKRATSASAAYHHTDASTSSTGSNPSSSFLRLNRSQSSARPSSPASSRLRAAGNAHAPGSPSKAMNFPSPPPTPPPNSPRQKPVPSTPSARPPSIAVRQRQSRQTEHMPSRIPIPFYISPIHLPSTNPTFSHLDPEREFASWADISGSRFKVTIWGSNKVESSRKSVQSCNSLKGKSKELSSFGSSRSTEDGPLWKVLEEWLVDLEDMEPLSPDLAAHHLPSNTLLLTLSSCQVFRLPPISFSDPSSTPTRVPSPLGPEYNSDGDLEDLRRHRLQQTASDTRRQERETSGKGLRETRMEKSATWQDLVKIINLRTCIIDNQESLDEVVRMCNTLLEDDWYDTYLRQCSELEELVNNLCAEREHVIQDSAEVRDAIKARKLALDLRRDTLTAARVIQEKQLQDLAAQAKEVVFEQQRHSTLISSLPPRRTALIQTVSFIFPIEPLSAPDLLFTVLGAPLPIPVSSPDPAPPPSLMSHPEVTEDNTATALGYVAQIVQLISAYLGKGLVYPVTCCGSRSIIKDPISAMMGPRIFPLYSKGVERYRFEYGVFLLNKDIEMIMMDRNLCAMDMRHTLPNLKNLLLTLTTGEEVKQTRRLASPLNVAISSDMRLPTRAISPLALDAQCEATSQIAIRSAVGIGSRKPTPFLSPLAAILRARYPSSTGHPTVKAVHETPEPIVESDGVEVASELQADTSNNGPSAPEQESKTLLKPNGIPHTPSSSGNSNPFEKLAKVDEPPRPPPLPGVI